MTPEPVPPALTMAEFESSPLPERIQRKRTRGWKMPANTVYVGRPTIFGNPFSTADQFRQWWQTRGQGFVLYPDAMDKLMGALFQTEPHPLRGKNLACWCPLNRPCHADILLELANPGGFGGTGTLLDGREWREMPT